VDYLGHARGSAGEVRAQLYVAHDQGYLSNNEFETTYDLADKASRQLFQLIQYLKSRPNASRIQEGSVEYEIDLDVYIKSTLLCKARFLSGRLKSPIGRF
jgi:hypothetical protein